MLSKLIEESYQSIQEVSRWKNEVAAGNLSGNSIERLKKEGVAKTKQDYIQGLQKGTSNIINQSGLTPKQNTMQFFGNGKEGMTDSLLGASTGGAYTNFNNKTVRIPEKMGIFNSLITPLNTRDKIEKELINRHEANEAKYGIQNIKNGYKFNDDLPIPLAKIGIDKKLLGVHNSMKVISDEAADTNFYNNLYGSAKNLKRLRNSVEGKVLKDKFGVGYNDINYNNKSKINQTISNYEKNTVFPEAKKKFEDLGWFPSPLQVQKVIKAPLDSYSLNTDGKATKELRSSVFKNYGDKIKSLWKRD